MQPPGYKIYIVKDFFLSETINNISKKQPAESKQTRYEELNEPSLKVFEDDNIIIIDNSRTK